MTIVRPEFRPKVQFSGESGGLDQLLPSNWPLLRDRGGWRADLRAVVTSEGRGRGNVPVDTGMAPVAAGLDQAALTSIIIGVTARGAGTLTSSMPFAYFASTSAASTPSGSPKLRWNAPYTTSRTK